MNKVKVVLILVLSLATMISFQNCSQTNFEQVGGLDNKIATLPQGQLVPIEVSNDVDDAKDASNNSDAKDSDEFQIAKEDNGQMSKDNREHETKKAEESAKKDSIVKRNQDLGVCVLEGKGNSQKVGFLEGSVANQPSAAKSICMSKEACLKTVKTFFRAPVKFQIQYCNPIAKLPSKDKDYKRIVMSDDKVKKYFSDQFEVVDNSN